MTETRGHKRLRKSRGYSLYYGAPPSANAFPTYSTADLLRDLESPKLDDETRSRIEAEVARRRQIKGTRQ